MERFQSSVLPVMIHIKVVNIVGAFCELCRVTYYKADYETEAEYTYYVASVPGYLQASYN